MPLGLAPPPPPAAADRGRKPPGLSSGASRVEMTLTRSWKNCGESMLMLDMGLISPSLPNMEALPKEDSEKLDLTVADSGGRPLPFPFPTPFPTPFPFPCPLPLAAAWVPNIADEPPATVAAAVVEVVEVEALAAENSGALPTTTGAASDHMPGVLWRRGGTRALPGALDTYGMAKPP